MKFIEYRSKCEKDSGITLLDLEERFTPGFSHDWIYKHSIDEEDKQTFRDVIQALQHESGNEELIQKLNDGNYNCVYVAKLNGQIDCIYFFI